MSDDAEAVRLFYETYGQYLTERQLEHIPDARLRILEQPSDSVPTLASIDQTRWEFEGTLTPLELADLCSRQAQHNWTLVQARLARTSKQLELYRAATRRLSRRGSKDRCRRRGGACLRATRRR